MNYEDMSDFDINCEVAIALYPQLGNADSDLVTDAGGGAANFRLCNAIGEDLDAGTYDYCNDPSDAWPIMLEMMEGGKALMLTTSKVNHDEGIASPDENPLRASMVVFLKTRSKS